MDPATIAALVSAAPALAHLFGFGGGSSAGTLDPQLAGTMKNILDYQYSQMTADRPLHDSIRQLAMYLLPKSMQTPIYPTTGSGGGDIANVVTQRHPTAAMLAASHDDVRSRGAHPFQV